MKSHKMKKLNQLFQKTLISSALALISTASFAALTDSTTDYTKDTQNYHVWNESLKPVDLVNSILCFTSQMKFSEFINAGPYLVLADEGACFKDDSSSNSQASGAANAPTYSKIVVDGKTIEYAWNGDIFCGPTKVTAVTNTKNLSGELKSVIHPKNGE